MFRTINPPSRSVLSPALALRLFDFYMKGACTIDDDNDIVMELCLDADSVLSRLQRPARKSLASIPFTSSASPVSNGDITLRQNIASAYYKLARLFEHLGYSDDAQRCDKKAKKWGYIQGNSNNDINNSNNNNNNIIITKHESTRTSRAEQVRTTATISKNIFNHNEPPTAIRCSLPDAGAHLNDTHQLAYCLSLLLTAPIQTNDLNDHEKDWCQAILNDQDEHKWLCKLASDVIELFINDEIKAETSVAEVVALSPVLDQAQFRALLKALINVISQNIILETHLLTGLAQLMQHAPPGYLDSDDLVAILNSLSSRLQGTHGQSIEHLYRLSATVSHVLDAMVNNQVKGLKREQLHEPLAAYLQGLKSSSDPHLVYQAAYAFQALQYISDDESTLQTMLRRTSAVVRGVFGVISAVKGLDLNAFMDEISNIQEGLPSVTGTIDMSLKVYTGATSLYESGSTFRQCMEEGLSFSHKSGWYPALRGADELIQSGEFTKFKTLVCEAPCRNDTAFQWGLCQRLGQIAADTQWTMNIRQDAITLLGEMYKNDQEWGNHTHVKQWILSILIELSSLSPNDLQAVDILLNELKKYGDLKEQELYRNCVQGPVTQHPFIIIHPPPSSSHLLDLVQNRPGVEDSLRQLKKRRMEVGNNQGFYIQQYAKASPQASDDKLFLLMDKVKEFLDSDQKVLLVQGDSGAGKSTFNRTLERTLWDAYQKRHGRIPLFINLPAIDKPEKDLVAKQLRHYDFTDSQIKELKKSRSFVLICDGYDESMQTTNLYVSNQLNKPGEWMAQMIVSCRSEYLGLDYRDRFQPMDRNHQADDGLFEEAVIMPFSETQIDEYIKQYVDAMDPMWRVEDYHCALKMVPSLQDLVKNPFMLSMSLEVLPRMVDPDQGVSNTKIKRVTLYDQFVEQWLERGKKRLSDAIGSEDRRVYNKLLDEGFAQNGIRYLTELAIAIYKHQDGNPVVDYSPSKDRGTWKEAYFSKENGRNLLREASPLTRTGNQHRFMHRSLLEYCLVRAMFEPQKAMSGSAIDEVAKATATTSRRQSISSVYSFEAMDMKEDEQEVEVVEVDEASPLVWRSFVDEASILHFLEDRVRLEPVFKQQLYEYVKLSKSDSRWRIAAANAMTILVQAGESFIEADLRGIQIPGADLSYGIFEYAQLQGADLRKVNLRKCWLREADLSGAKMAGVQFGEWPLLEVGGAVRYGSYSPDGKTLAAVIKDGSDNYSVAIYDTSTWMMLSTLEGNGIGNRFIYSPDSRYIASWGSPQTAVLVWNVTSGILVHRLEGHTNLVNCVVYSPDGKHLASASDDKSVLVWDIQSGVLKYRLEGHTGRVRSVTYSPDGLRIATGSRDGTVRLWDAISGQQLMRMDRVPGIEQIVYSPNGQEIISHCAGKSYLYVWDVGSSQKKYGLDHDNSVCGIQYSPNGKFVASSAGSTVFLWYMQTGMLIHILLGHTERIMDLRYSPNGEQIATCSIDSTVRLWDTRSGQIMNTFYGHFSEICCVTYSPNNHQLASFSDDKTIRLWDTRLQKYNRNSYDHPLLVYPIMSSSDGKQIALHSTKLLCVWDARTGQSIHVLQIPDKYTWDIKYSPDGRLLASRRYNSSRVYLWNARTGQVTHTLELQDRQYDWIYAFDFSPIDHRIACGHRRGYVTIWNTQTGELIHTLRSHKSVVGCVVFSPDGHHLASIDEGGALRVWTVHSGGLCYKVKDGERGSNPVKYTPDSQKIVFCPRFISRGLKVRNAKTGELCYTLPGHYTGIGTFSPCSQRMADARSNGQIDVLHMETGVVLYTLKGHTREIREMAYSPDGKYIASSSYDKTVRVWDAETGECLVVILCEGGFVRTLVWNTFEEGYFLVTGSEDASVRMWQIVKKDDQYQYWLKWSTRQTTLNVRNMCIQDVTGLSEINRRLLEQRGTIGERSLPLAVDELSKQIVTTPLMALKRDASSGQMDLHQGPVVTVSGMPLTAATAPSRSIKDFQFKYSVCSECNFAHVIACRPCDEGKQSTACH